MESGLWKEYLGQGRPLARFEWGLQNLKGANWKTQYYGSFSVEGCNVTGVGYHKSF